MTDWRLGQSSPSSAVGNTDGPLTPLGHQPVPQEPTARFASDQTALAAHRAGSATAGADPRSEKALAMALAMIEPAPDSRTGFEKWTQPAADVATQTHRGLRLVADLQNAQALPAVFRVIQRGGDSASEARNVFMNLLPFADAHMLDRLQTALGADAQYADLQQAVTATVAERGRSVGPKAAEHSGAEVHWREAGRGVIDFVEDITVGTAKQVWHDPLHFPTQLVWGMGSSLHHALHDSGGAIAGLLTAGKLGSFGAQMTQEIGNAGMWTSGFAKPRETNMHPEFAEVHKLTEKGFARDLGGRAQFVSPKPIIGTWMQNKLGVHPAIANVVNKAERGFLHGVGKLYYGTHVILPGEEGYRPGAIWKDLGTEPMKTDHVLGTANKQLFDHFSNKYNEASMMNQHAEGSMPSTLKGTQLLQKLGLELPKTEAERPAFLEALQAKLKEEYPNGFFMKGVNDYNTAGNLPTNKTNFVEMYAGFKREFEPFAAKIKAENVEGADIQPHVRTHPYHAGRAIDQLMNNPETVIIQERLPLKKYTTKDVGPAKQPYNEFRLHIVHGKVVPGATSHRWSVWQWLTQGKTLRAAEAWAQGQVDKLPQHITHTTALCPDVVQLEDGSFKFIEMNAMGNSGFLHLNPIAAHRLVEAVTGKETAVAYTMRRVGRGALAATTVATHQEQPLPKPSQDDAKSTPH